MEGTRAFTKMQGLGNDFVVFDAREQPVELEPVEIVAIADRRIGVGCDQVLVVRNSERADAYMQIFNADGSEVGACGNGARCVGREIMREKGEGRATLETKSGLLGVFDGGDGMITVDMGPVRTDWKEIPLSEERDTLHLDFEIANDQDPDADPLLWDPAAVNVGNPHVVFLVKDPWAVDLARIGPLVADAALFPEGANVGLAKVTGEDTIQLRVWERGAGETAACGTAACAALITASRSGAMGKSAVVELPGGPVGVVWRDDNHVLLTGPAQTAYNGTVDMDPLLRGLMEKLAAEKK
jgi:diaminopimelate epimerase